MVTKVTQAEVESGLEVEGTDQPFALIIESVDSIGRDGTDTPIFNKTPQKSDPINFHSHDLEHISYLSSPRTFTETSVHG